MIELGIAADNFFLKKGPVCFSEFLRRDIGELTLNELKQFLGEAKTAFGPKDSNSSTSSRQQIQREGAEGKLLFN